MICLSALLPFSAKNQQKPHLNSPNMPCLTSSKCHSKQPHELVISCSHWIPSLKTNSSHPAGGLFPPKETHLNQPWWCELLVSGRVCQNILETHMFFKGMLTCWGNSCCKVCEETLDYGIKCCPRSLKSAISIDGSITCHWWRREGSS